MSMQRVLFAYRFLFVAFIIAASAQTLVTAHAHKGLSPKFLTALASVEIVAAVLFIFHQTQMIGAALLLAVFAVATVASVTAGDMPAHFFYYAGTTLFIVWLDRHIQPV